MTKWTAEYRREYMREYYRAHRDWIRTTWQLWYARNRQAHNRRKRASYARKRKETINVGA